MWSAVRGSLAAAAVTLALTVPVSGQRRMADDGGLAFLTSSMRAQAAALPSHAPTTANDLGVAASVIALPTAMQRQNQNVTMMIVGGAAMIVGSAIAGDAGTIMIVGGGALGLIGLFRYLN